MRERSTRDSAHCKIVHTIILAVLFLVVASCTTAPTTRPVPADAEPAERPVAENSEVPEEFEAPEPASVPEGVPKQSGSAPEPVPEPEPAPAPEAGSETRSAPTAIRSEPAEPERAPADVTQPAPAPQPSTDPAPASLVLRGRVTLDVSKVDEVDDDSVRDTVVYFKPAGAARSVAPRNFEITTRRKRLIPHVLVVPVGSTVAFPNEDDILHNVFSVSPAANFDLGLYGEDESKSHTFAEPGLAVIHCNVHHAMRADVLVVDTPFFAQPGLDGSFSIDGIESPAGELVAWHPRAGFVRRQLSLPLAEPLDVELALVRPRIPDHLDKTGQPYRPERPGRQ